MKIVSKIAIAAMAAVTAGAVGYGISAASPATPVSPNASAAQREAALAPLAPTTPAHPDSVFVSVPNCRIVNTANAGGRIPNGGTRNFQVTGTSGFPGQGGQNLGCGIPIYATAVSARISSTGALGNGAFIAYPTGAPTGQGTLYYAKGVNVTTGANLQIGTGGKITIKNVLGPAFTAIDVNGYFAPQIHAVLVSTGGILSGSPQVLSSVHNSTGSYTVTIDHDLTGCTPIASIHGSAFIASAYTSGNTVRANTYTTSGTPADLYWVLTVIC